MVAQYAVPGQFVAFGQAFEDHAHLPRTFGVAGHPGDLDVAGHGAFGDPRHHRQDRFAECARV